MEETPNTTRLTFSEILNKLTNAYLHIVAGIVRRLLHSFSGSLAHHKNQANQILLIRQIREGLYMTVYFLLQLEEQRTERLPGGCACALSSNGSWRIDLWRSKQRPFSLYTRPRVQNLRVKSTTSTGQFNQPVRETLFPKSRWLSAPSCPLSEYNTKNKIR
jgi:hypothetical protein